MHCFLRTTCCLNRFPCLATSTFSSMSLVSGKLVMTCRKEACHREELIRQSSWWSVHGAQGRSWKSNEIRWETLPMMPWVRDGGGVRRIQITHAAYIVMCVSRSNNKRKNCFLDLQFTIFYAILWCHEYSLSVASWFKTSLATLFSVT